MNFKTKCIVKYFYVMFLLFLILFDLALPPFGVFGSAWLALLLLFPKFFLLRDKFFIFKKYKALIILYFFGFFYVVLIITVNGAIDVSYVLSFLKSSVVMIASLFFLSVYRDKNIGKLLVVAFFINSLICLIVGTFSEKLLHYILYFKHSGDEMVDYIVYRVSSLSGSGYFGMSAPYSLCVAFIGYYLAVSKENIIFFLFVFVSVSLAAILSGRTGFIGIFLALVFILYYKPFMIIPVHFVLVGIGFFLLNSGFVDSYRDWLFEFFIDSSGNLSSDRTPFSFLSQMSFVPSVSTFIFGDGQYVAPDGHYYGKTDLGYMRFLLFGGIPFSVISISLVIVLSIVARSYSYFFVIGVTCLILHLKGVVFFNNAAVTSFMILVSYNFKLISMRGVNE
ncbi:MAG: oligosaccharide repeat unit polymerase [Gammaproteobacteria bacterium]|nr:oligosaccharide repeat unit polymerase [Gammaproteobacteria bacterium]MBU2240645.1 oligosaccharide repeat unit polymerase [Gammaproteobacteria bacterium]